MIDEVKKMLGSDKMIIGSRVVLKAIRKGNVKKVFLSKNAEEALVKDIEHYKSLSDFEIVVLKIPNDELGTLCKKPFSVSVIGVLR